MPTYLAPGVYMEEVDKGPKPIEAVATAVAGFVGIAARGPLNKAISVNSWSDYVRIFGGYAEDSLMSYAAFGYFNNGGQNAYVVRVANPDTMRRARYILSHQAPNRSATTFTISDSVPAGATSALVTDVTGLAPDDELDFGGGQLVTLISVDKDTSTVTFAALGAAVAAAGTATVTPSAVVAWTLSATANPGDTVIQVTDASGIGVGDKIKLKDGTTEHVATVKSSNAATNTIVLEDADAVPSGKTFTDAGTAITPDTPAAAPASVAFQSVSAAVLTEGTTGLPMGTRLLIGEAGSGTGETVTVVAVSDDGTLTWTPSLKATYTSPEITVQPTAAFPTEYALAADASATDTITLTDASGLAVGDTIAFWETKDDPETRSIKSISGATVTLDSAFTESYTTSTIVAPHPGLALQAAPDADALIGEDTDAQSNGQGTWGNDIQVRVDEYSLLRTKLKNAMPAVTAKEADLAVVQGVSAGTLLKFTNRKTGAEAYRIVDAVYATQKRVGWAADLDGSLFPVADTDIATVEFRLTARHRWSGVQESFAGLSVNATYADQYALTVLNTTDGERKASSLVNVVKNLTSSGIDPQLQVPAAMKKGEWHNLRGGRNGSQDITVSEFKGQNLGPDARSGLACFEGVDQVTMVICADAVGSDDTGTKLFGGAATQVASLHEALLEHAALMADRFAIVDCRESLGLSDVQEQRQQHDTKYGAFYYPWIQVDNPLSATGDFKKVPPSGHMAGVYARVDRERGVHKAPANELVYGARGLEVQVSMAEQNLLNPMGINCIRKFPGRGIRVWGARTMSSDASWRYINVRRLFLQIEESIEEGTQWTVFEPNDQTLWAKIRRDVGAFLKRFYLQGAFFGTTPEEAYFVKCDAETNPPEVIDAGQVVIEVGIAPVKPAEFVIFRIGQKPTGGSVEE